MRTNIVIDQHLMDEAMTLSGYQTKKAVVDQALQLFVKLKKQEAVKQHFGQIQWEGDLETMRRNDHG